MSFPSRSPNNSFPQYIRKEDPRFMAIHRSMMKDQLQQPPPPSLSRSKSTGSSSLAYNSVNVAPRRLSSGSACEVCRKRKTKCDGGNPCAFCSANGVECVHRATRRKKSSLAIGSSTMATTTTTTMNHSNNNNNNNSGGNQITSTTTATPPLFNNNNNIIRNHTNHYSYSSTNDNSNNNNNNNPNNATLLNCNEGGSGMSPTLAITTSSTHIHHNDTAPSWVKELEGPSRNNLLKQTSCPSLIVTTHWSPTTPPHPSLTPTNDPSSIGGYTPTTTTTTNTTSTGYSLNNHNPPYPSSHENRITRGDGGHRGKEEIPSMMDQLSCRTFSAAAFVDHRTNYPIYPLSSGSEPITTTTKTTTTTTNHPSHRSDIRASTSPTSSNTSLKMDHFPL